MKAKLINRWGNYRLYVNETPYASTGDSPYKKLSKQNCDGLFGMVDIETFIIEDSKDKTIYNESYELGFKRAMKLFQPNEIDVEIELICPHPLDTYRCGLQYGCDGDGCNHPDQVPYLDSNGCLILKKI
jgi:hypothetical protein